jgi:hypothetical protein
MNKYKKELTEWAVEQVDHGFDPFYLVTINLENPNDWIRNKRETYNNPLGHQDRYGMNTKVDGIHLSAMNYIERMSLDYWRYRRGNEDLVSKDIKKSINVILYKYYGIKRLDKYGDSINRLVFLELGKQRSEKQLHAHILLPKRLQGDSPEELDLVLAQLSNKVKSVSKQRTPHMDTIDTLILDDKYKMYNTPQKRVCAYCCKETKKDHIPLDIWNSKPIRK